MQPSSTDPFLGSHNPSAPLINELPRNYDATKRRQQLKTAASGRPNLTKGRSVLKTVVRLSRASTNIMHSRYSWLYSMLNPHSKRPQAKTFKFIISIVILVDLFLFILSTNPKLERSHHRFFYVCEGAVSCIFVVEYVCRLYCITEKQKYGQHGPVLGRLYYMFWSYSAWIDLLATAPWFIEVCTGLSLPQLTILRIFRLFRILKTESYIRTADAVYRVIYYNSEILWVAVLVCVFLTLATAILLYLLRPKGDPNFNSIMGTMYLSILMLTGQGGPEGDLPWYTKLVVLLTSVFSVAMFAIPASMLTWGFEAEAERMAKRARERAAKPKSAYSTTSSDNDTTDDEYFKLIAGVDDDEGEDDNESPFMKQLRANFEAADVNEDGTLTFKEATGLLSSGGGAGMDPVRLDRLEASLKEQDQKLNRILGLLEGRP